MQNPAHTLIINWDAEGNIEYRDLATGVEGTVPSGDELMIRGECGRRIHIYTEAEETEAEEGLPCAR